MKGGSAMEIATCRRACLAILTMLSLTAAMAVGDADTSSRRGYQEPANPYPHPEVIVEPDYPGGTGMLGDGQVFCPEGYCESYGDFSSSYGSSCNAGGACDYCPCWTFRGGLVSLRRDSNSAIPIIVGVPSYSSGDLGFDDETGGALTIIRHGFLQSCWDLEATYFGVDDFGASAVTTDLNTLLTAPNLAVGGVNPGRTDYTSELDSAEFNLRRQWNQWLTLMGGMRWVNLNEVMNTNIGGAANHRIDVDNQLWGFQLGADTYLWSRGRFSLEGYGKVGIYANNSDARTTTAGLGALPVIVASENDAAFVGDLGFTGVYDISDRWSVRGGYQFLWIDGVALAPEQLDNMNVLTGVANVDVGQTAFYHGLNLAAEFRY
jgi:hypothetical protein